MQIFLRSLAAVLLITLLSGFGSGERLFAPDADLWPRWQKSDEASTAVVNHAVWDAFLKRYVDVNPSGVNLVRYAGVSADDRRQLERYVGDLAAVPVSSYNRAEQLAYWLNLYNALTVQVVLQHFPVETIRNIDISPGFFADGPWGKELVSVEGQGLSLNDIEHRILRPVWRDARIHYGVNCASVGCPDLRQDAFTGATVDDALNVAARDYINDSRGVSVAGNTITVSKIYDWFIDDFGGDEAGVMSHLLLFADQPLSDELRRIGKLYDVQYDWSLNGAVK